MRPDLFERSVRFVAAYDKRETGHGTHGVDMHMVLLGPDGAIEFVVSTGWHWHEPYGADGRDLNYHSHGPILDSTEVARADCKILDGPCYTGDGSGLRAKPIFDALLREGSEGVWRMLREEYDAVFTEENREQARQLSQREWPRFVEHMDRHPEAFSRTHVEEMIALLKKRMEDAS